MDYVKLTRAERIKMFLYEYYFGVNGFYKVFRLIGGLVLFFFGYQLYFDASDRFGIGYGGFVLLFSVYYILKPFLWVAFRWKSYKETSCELEANLDHFYIKDELSEGKINYSAFQKVAKRSFYISIKLENNSKVYLPLSQLSEQTIERLSVLIAK